MLHAPAKQNDSSGIVTGERGEAAPVERDHTPEHSSVQQKHEEASTQRRVRENRHRAPTLVLGFTRSLSLSSSSSEGITGNKEEGDREEGVPAHPVSNIRQKKKHPEGWRGHATATPFSCRVARTLSTLKVQVMSLSRRKPQSREKGKEKKNELVGKKSGRRASTKRRARGM